jgi:hypothetical protein
MDQLSFLLEDGFMFAPDLVSGEGEGQDSIATDMGGVVSATSLDSTSYLPHHFDAIVTPHQPVSPFIPFDEGDAEEASSAIDLLLAHWLDDLVGEKG